MPSSLGVPVQAANKSRGRRNPIAIGFIFLNNWVDDVNTVCLFGQYNARLPAHAGTDGNDAVGQAYLSFDKLRKEGPGSFIIIEKKLFPEAKIIYEGQAAIKIRRICDQSCLNK